MLLERGKRSIRAIKGLSPYLMIQVASLLLLLAAAALFAAPFLPIWRITLDAPQYPEGMGMLIWAHTITGQNPHDLDIINQLNHYIGMKSIVPDSIPELRFMRWLIHFVGVLCLVVAFRPRFWSAILLLLVFTALGVVGIADMWFWGYDYGHDLDPAAAIKIPGASFQPPLIGPGDVLNFQSTSWPDWGGVLILLAGLLVAGAVLLTWMYRLPEGQPKRRSSGVPAALVLFLIACGEQEPAPIFWGEDSCHHCKMTLVQKGFAAQRITSKGKVFKYDAIECLLADTRSSPLLPQERAYVSNWSRPEDPLMPVEGALYLSGEYVASPMGGGLAAFSSPDSALAFRKRLGGEILKWADLVKP